MVLPLIEQLINSHFGTAVAAAPAPRLAAVAMTPQTALTILSNPYAAAAAALRFSAAGRRARRR